MEDDFLKIMWHEHYARDGFLMQLRLDLEWDKAAFERMTNAMRLCCKQYEVISAAQQKAQMEQAARGLQETAEQPVTPEDEDEETDPPLPETRRLLPDWLVLYFWYTSEQTIGITAHSAWKKQREEEPEYFQKAYQRLKLLAGWFFSGRCPWYDEEQGWASTSVQ